MGGTGSRSTISLLSLPKSALGAEDLRDFVTALGFRAAFRPGGDLVPLGRDPAFLIGVLQSLRSGSAKIAGAPGVN